MDKSTATEALRAHPTAEIVLVSRDATGTHHTRHAAWLDEDGQLVIAHPQPDRRHPIEAPECDGYQFVLHYAQLDDATAARATVTKLLTESEYLAAVERAEQYAAALRRSAHDTSARQMRTDRRLVATPLAIEAGERVWLSSLRAAPSTTIHTAA